MFRSCPGLRHSWWLSWRNCYSISLSLSEVSWFVGQIRQYCPPQHLHSLGHLAMRSKYCQVHGWEVGIPFQVSEPQLTGLYFLPLSAHGSMAHALHCGVFGGKRALRHGIAISGQTMASFSSPNETFPLPNSSALSLAVVFVDNSYNEEAIKKIQNVLPGLSLPLPEGAPASSGWGLNDSEVDSGARSGHLYYSWII